MDMAQKINKSFLEKVKQLFKPITNLVEIGNVLKITIELIIHGALINFITVVFLKTPLAIELTIAFGLIWYFVFYEFPILLNKTRRS